MNDQEMKSLPEAWQSENTPRGSWIVGIFALWIGFAYMMLVYFMYALPFLLLFGLCVGVVTVIGVEPNMAFGVGSIVMAPFSIVFLTWIASRFFFPVYFRFGGRVGWFLQKAAYVSLGDTVGDVKQYEAVLRSDVKRLVRWFRAKK